MRAHPLHRTTPVIIMTADAAIKEVPGSNAFVRKPFDVTRLAGILAQQYARWTN